MQMERARVAEQRSEAAAESAAARAKEDRLRALEVARAEAEARAAAHAAAEEVRRVGICFSHTVLTLPAGTLSLLSLNVQALGPCSHALVYLKI
jgi:hypothetical protein